jgi:hypothetical protein
MLSDVCSALVSALTDGKADSPGLAYYDRLRINRPELAINEVLRRAVSAAAKADREGKREDTRLAWTHERGHEKGVGTVTFSLGFAS